MPEFYQIYLKSQLEPCQYLLLTILIDLLQSIKVVKLEALATALPEDEFCNKVDSPQLGYLSVPVERHVVKGCPLYYETLLPLPIKFESRHHRQREIFVATDIQGRNTLVPLYSKLVSHCCIPVIKYFILRLIVLTGSGLIC